MVVSSIEIQPTIFLFCKYNSLYFARMSSPLLNGLSSGIGSLSGCSDGVNWFRGNGQWQGRNYEPATVDIIFFD